MKDMDISTIKADILKKGSDAELQDLRKRFHVFQDVENMYNFEHIYLPRMKKFFDSVDALHQSNADMREIIVNFDKRLSMKLNKSQLLTLKQDLNNSYIPNEFKEVVTSKFDKMQNVIKANERTMSGIVPECMDKVNAIVVDSLSELLTEKFQKYDKVASSFQGFFNAEDLMSQLDKKVDGSMLDQIVSRLAEKSQINQV